MHSAINWKMLYTSVSAIIRQYLLAIQSICCGRSLFVPAFAFACGLRYLGIEYLWCVDSVVIEFRGCTSRVASPNRTQVLCCCSR